MKLKIEKHKIYNNLSIMTKLPMSKKSDKLLKDSIYVEVKNGHMNLISYDGYEIYVEVSVPISINYYEEGISRFESKLFTKLVKSLKSDIFINDDKRRCNIISDRTRFELPSSAISDKLSNLRITKVENEYRRYIVEQQKLKKALEATLCSVSDDINQLELMNVMVELGSDMLKVVATDGYRIMIVEEEYLENNNNDDDMVLLPKNAVTLINSFLKGDGTVEIRVNDDAICFVLGEVHMHIRRDKKLEYPDIKRILDMEMGSIVEVNKNELLRSIEQMKTVGAKVITMSSSKDLLKISGDGGLNNDKLLLGESVVEMDNANVSNISISFRLNHLKDGLRMMDTDKVSITIKDEDNFIVIRAKSNKILYVVMPCRV